MDLSELIGDMKVVTVSGAHKGVGKTALAELILHILSGFAAIKVTLTDLYTSVSDDEEELMVPDTDTYRMKESGAEKVVWIRSTEERLRDAMEEALRIISNHKGVFIEGNSILEYLDPTLAFFVIDGTIDHMKPSRMRALKKADVCAVNQKNGYTVSEETIQKVKSFNQKIKILSFDFSSSNDNESLKRLKEYLKKGLTSIPQLE